MTKHKFIAILLLTMFAVGYSGSAEAQFWKKKKHTHKSKQQKKKTEDNNDAAVNEEDVRSDDKDKTTTHQLTRKERKELKKKEKRERKEKEKKERQERKDREHQEKNNKKKKGKKTVQTVAKSPVGVIRKWADIEYVPTVKKAHYRIDILAPLYLDELVKNGYAVRDIPEKAQTGLNFYKGIQIAADSLKKANFDIDIFVHDVASLLESTEMLVRKNMLDSSDLIIGAVPSKDIPSLAAYAKVKHINFVSATATVEGIVRDNQYLTVLQPSLHAYCEQILNRVATENKAGAKLLLYRTYLGTENTLLHYFTDDSAAKSTLSLLSCNTLPKKDAIAALIDPAKVNTIILPVLDNVYADSLLKIFKNEFPNTRFEVYAMPTLATLQGLNKQGMYPNMNIYVTMPFSFDPANASVQYIDKAYKKEYGGKPQEMVYRGYEAMFWYANLLQRHGTIFNKQYSDNEIAPFTRYEIKPHWDADGNVLYMENTHSGFTKYSNGVVSGNR